MSIRAKPRNIFLRRSIVKATGIVRRIDDLGRVVIPKEIRRTLRIREGDPLLITLSQLESEEKRAERFIRAINKLLST